MFLDINVKNFELEKSKQDQSDQSINNSFDRTGCQI